MDELRKSEVCPARDLLECALARRLARPPAQQSGAMAKAVCRDMIEADLHHKLRSHGSQSPLRCVLQRLGPPGALPVKPGGLRNASRRLVSLPRSALPIVDVKPTWSSLPWPS